MNIIGLTGSMATGKSFVAAYCMTKGIAVFEADIEVHDIIKNEAKQAIIEQFPSCVDAEGKISRSLLGRLVFADDAALEQLEHIIYPYLEVRSHAFLARHLAADLVIMDIPLLYEKKWDLICDQVIVTTVDEATQYQRAFERDGMTEARYQVIRNKQQEEIIKCKKADYVLDTGCDRADLYQQIDRILEAVT